MDVSELNCALAKTGWATVLRTRSEPCAHSLKYIVAELGASRIAYSLLKPSSAEDAKSNSLSQRYGLNQFPLHTDFAYIKVPPRFLIFAASSRRKTRTLVLDCLSSGLLSNVNCEALFNIRGGRLAFYGHFIEQHPNRQLFRFNRDVMIPVNQQAFSVVSDIDAMSSLAVEIDWREVKILVVDNWRCLHSRGKVSCLNDPIRRLAIWRY